MTDLEMVLTMSALSMQTTPKEPSSHDKITQSVLSIPSTGTDENKNDNEQHDVLKMKFDSTNSKSSSLLKILIPVNQQTKTGETNSVKLPSIQLFSDEKNSSLITDNKNSEKSTNAITNLVEKKNDQLLTDLSQLPMIPLNTSKDSGNTETQVIHDIERIFTPTTLHEQTVPMEIESGKKSGTVHEQECEDFILKEDDDKHEKSTNSNGSVNDESDDSSDDEMSTTGSTSGSYSSESSSYSTTRSTSRSKSKSHEESVDTTRWSSSENHTEYTGDASECVEDNNENTANDGDPEPSQGDNCDDSTWNSFDPNDHYEIEDPNEQHEMEEKQREMKEIVDKLDNVMSEESCDDTNEKKKLEQLNSTLITTRKLNAQKCGSVIKGDEKKRRGKKTKLEEMLERMKNNSREERVNNLSEMKSDESKIVKSLEVQLYGEPVVPDPITFMGTVKRHDNMIIATNKVNIPISIEQKKTCEEELNDNKKNEVLETCTIEKENKVLNEHKSLKDGENNESVPVQNSSNCRDNNETVLRNEPIIECDTVNSNNSCNNSHNDDFNTNSNEGFNDNSSESSNKSNDTVNNDKEQNVTSGEECVTQFENELMEETKDALDSFVHNQSVVSDSLHGNKHILDNGNEYSPKKKIGEYNSNEIEMDKMSSNKMKSNQYHASIEKSDNNKIVVQRKLKSDTITDQINGIKEQIMELQRQLEQCELARYDINNTDGYNKYRQWSREMGVPVSQLFSSESSGNSSYSNENVINVQSEDSREEEPSTSFNEMYEWNECVKPYGTLKSNNRSAYMADTSESLRSDESIEPPKMAESQKKRKESRPKERSRSNEMSDKKYKEFLKKMYQKRSAIIENVCEYLNDELEHEEVLSPEIVLAYHQVKNHLMNSTYDL